MAKGGTVFDMAGAKEVEDLLDSLPLAVQGKILYAINRRAAKIAKDELQANAPSTEIASKIQIVKDSTNLTGVLVRPSKKVYYVRFLEYGTEVRQTKEGANRGDISEGKKPFIRKSYAVAGPKIISEVIPKYRELIVKQMQKESKRIARAIKKLDS